MRKRSEGHYQRLLQNKSQNTEERIQNPPATLCLCEQASANQSHGEFVPDLLE